MHHKLRLKQDKKKAKHRRPSAELPPAETPAAPPRGPDHVPLASGLSQIVSQELGDSQPHQREELLHQLQLQQQQRHLQELAQQTTQNAIVTMMANAALGFPALSPFASSLERPAALSTLHLQQLLLHQHRQTQHQLLQRQEQQQLQLLQQQEQQQRQASQPSQPSQFQSQASSREALTAESRRHQGKKRHLEDDEEDDPEQFDDDDDDATNRFRTYQSDQWKNKFMELEQFRKAKGHCQVPHTYAENPPLARWVKRQRYQYKLKSENRQSTMTEERIQMLEKVGFIWDSHAAAWAEKLNELKDYARAFGTCNVPSTYPENPQLATWVKCQRRQYKLLRDGKTSNMTLERISQLESLGFVWEMRKN